MADDMTFVHLSDPHIEEEGIHYWDILDGYKDTVRVLAHIRETGVEPDFFLITGDLIQGHEHDDYRAYSRFNEVMDMLSRNFGVPVLLALGNGDVTAPFRSVVLGEEESDKPYYYSRVIRDLKVIVLDTHIKAHRGEIDREQLQWLDQELAADPGMDHILAMHHMPAKTVLGPDLYELRNAEALKDVIEGRNIIGILGGHVHISFMSAFAGIPCVTARGVCSTVVWNNHKEKLHLHFSPGYNLVHIRDRRMMVQFIELPGPEGTLRLIEGFHHFHED